MINSFEIPKKSGIYLLRSKISGKIYIGKSININHRINYGHRVDFRGKNHITKAIKKYGFHNFEIEVLHDFEHTDEITLLALETAFIDFYESTNPTIGYNICLFHTDRTGIKMSTAQKQLLSKTRKGKKMGEENAFFGQHHSSETKQILTDSWKSKYRNGYINPRKGASLTSATKQKISQNHANMQGLNNPRCDHQIYTFKNLKTGERFCGTRFDFGCKFNLIAPQTTCIVQGKMRKKWILA